MEFVMLLDELEQIVESVRIVRFNNTETNYTFVVTIINNLNKHNGVM